MYILVNDKNKVLYTSEKPFLKFSENLNLLEVPSIPEGYDYLTCENIREKSDEWTENKLLEDYDENGNVVVKEVEVKKSKKYKTCDLVGGFYPKKEPTLEELNKKLDSVREKKIVKLIRKKYSIDEELAILRQKDTKPEKFNEYFNYVEACVDSVPKQN